MTKSYADFMNEISASELYEGLLAYGLFSEKLPPVFSSVDFYNYTQKLKNSFANNRKDYIYYESMRNINIPRPLGIPNPMAYQRLCKYLSDNWEKLKEYFYQQTSMQTYKVSRIHIRKRRGTKSLFEMNYSNWEIDGTPETDLLIGKRYLVKADISTCFASIYTHSISWALVGKEYAKKHIQNKYSKEWYNRIDHYAQNCKNGETHGLLIGPHASNLLSEIILTAIDKQLNDKGYRYVRNIDDYICYVEKYEDAQRFLTVLTNELRQFDLTLNFKKTEIRELPIASVDIWVRKLRSINMVQSKGILDFNAVSRYLDCAIELMKVNKTNSAILNYTIKVLSKQQLSNNAKKYYIKTVFHLSILYPYLLPILEKNVFEIFTVEVHQIASFSQILFKEGTNSNNYEEICFAIYYAIKYGFDIEEIKADLAIESNSCIYKLFVFLYFKVRCNTEEMDKLKQHAYTLLQSNEFDSNWLFVYEVLPQSDLKDEWKNMKKENISFVKLQNIN